MNENKVGLRDKISMLWVIVMFNMVFADILNFATPGVIESLISGHTEGVQITQELLFVSAFLIEIPIAMIFLSKVLKNNANRWSNILAAVITSVFVIGGGTLTLSYVFFATVEVLCMFLISIYAWKLMRQE